MTDAWIDAQHHAARDLHAVAAAREAREPARAQAEGARDLSAGRRHVSGRAA